MKRIYCISGLGADERVFQRLSIANATLIPIKWPAINWDDSMRSYAKKIAEQIQGEQPILLGLSLGGMLATEIGKLIITEKVFLISSAKTRKELGYNFPLWKFAVNKHLVAFGLFKSLAPLSRYRLDLKTPEERILIADMIKKTSLDFMKCAIHMIINWDNTIVNNDIIHIHGTKDKIITPKNIKATHWIEGGGHFMIYNKAEIISKLVSQHL